MSLNHSDVRASACIWPWLHEREKERVKPIVYRLPHFIVVCTLWEPRWLHLYGESQRIFLFWSFSRSLFNSLLHFRVLLFNLAPSSVNRLFSLSLHWNESNVARFVRVMTFYAAPHSIGKFHLVKRVWNWFYFACMLAYDADGNVLVIVERSFPLFLLLSLPPPLPFGSRIRVSHKDYGRAFECAVCAVHV